MVLGSSSRFCCSTLTSLKKLATKNESGCIWKDVRHTPSAAFKEIYMQQSAS